eukprot:TRINITY_DN2867_c0_g1_i1.p2 TRINITY_DN2867_c0_g1~~TRINITY_DN2867_c0_g1_i1.p2  ORF type:complete len:310 (-),score=52.77 TRINITY_DN2867_c0_g1_i1:1107-2036(-)
MEKIYLTNKNGDIMGDEQPQERKRVRRGRFKELEDILADAEQKHMFNLFLINTLSDENLAYYDDVHVFKEMEPGKGKNKYGKNIFDLYIHRDGNKLINIPSHLYNAIIERMGENTFDHDIFDDTLEHIFRLLASDCLPKFKNKLKKDEEMLEIINVGVKISDEKKRKIKLNINGLENQFDRILSDIELYTAFQNFLNKEFAGDTLNFYRTVHSFNSRMDTEDELTVTETAQAIADRYLGLGAEGEILRLPVVSFDNNLREEISEALMNNNCTKDMFNWMMDEALSYLQTVYIEFVLYYKNSRKRKKFWR